MPIRPILASLFILAATLADASPSHAGTYLNKEQALQLAFPASDRIETTTLFLTEDQQRQVARLSGATPLSALHTFYRGHAGEEVIGYAAIEAATVRTLPQTLLIVLDPACGIRFVEILAFFEPEEYLPSRRWLDQFTGRDLSPALRIGGDLQGISGATLSVHAVARQARQAAALCTMIDGRE